MPEFPSRTSISVVRRPADTYGFFWKGCGSRANDVTKKDKKEPKGAGDTVGAAREMDGLVAWEGSLQGEGSVTGARAPTSRHL